MCEGNGVVVCSYVCVLFLSLFFCNSFSCCTVVLYIQVQVHIYVHVVGIFVELHVQCWKYVPIIYTIFLQHESHHIPCGEKNV